MIGSVVAGHRIERLVGRGGMGVVYRATELALDRAVALKLVAPELAGDPAFRERFLAEARTAASLDHRTCSRCSARARRTASCSSRCGSSTATTCARWSSATARLRRHAPRGSSRRSARRSTPRTRAGSCTAT